MLSIFRQWHSHLLCRKDPQLYADATPFFQAIHNAAWEKQVVLSPHPYCPAVTAATDHYQGDSTGFSQLQLGQ